MLKKFWIRGLFILLGLWAALALSYSNSLEARLQERSKVEILKQMREQGSPTQQIGTISLTLIPKQNYEKALPKVDIYLAQWSKRLENYICHLAVDAKGRIFLLPEEFSALKQILKLDLSEHQVKALMEVWLYTKEHIPLTDKPVEGIIILDSFKSIPWERKAQSNLEPARLASTVTPFKITKFNNALWHLDFYTWQKIGGAVKNWRIEIIDPLQLFKIKAQSKVIKRNVGDALYIY
jgi:hypothetical protein